MSGRRDIALTDAATDKSYDLIIYTENLPNFAEVALKDSGNEFVSSVQVEIYEGKLQILIYHNFGVEADEEPEIVVVREMTDEFLSKED